MDLNFTNLSDTIFHHAANKPNFPALVEGARVLTYAEFARCIGAACWYLSGLGIHADTRVGLLLDNHADHFILAFALMRIGAVPIEIAVDMSAAAQDDVLARYAIGTVFVESDALAGKRVAQRVIVDLHWRRLLDGYNGDARDPRPATENRLVMLTSGTSGPPKGVVSTHAQRLERIRAHAELLHTCWSPQQAGNFLLTLPISNAGFHQLFLMQMVFGGTVHVLPQFARFYHFVRTISHYDAAVCVATANMCRVLLASRGQQQPYLPNVQALISVGLPLSPQEKRGLYEYVTPHYYESYGASGFGMITGLQPDEVASKAETVGLACSAAEIEIVDNQGTVLAAGVVGHVRCRGLAMSDGFLLASDAAAAGNERFAEGWYYPGDLGAVDGDGYLHLKGRKSDLIVRQGIEVYPFEIEAALRILPAVKDVAVIGLPDADGLGAVPVAVVVSDDHFHAGFWQAFCAASLRPEQRPAYFLQTPFIKKTPSGKIDRSALRALVVANRDVLLAV